MKKALLFLVMVSCTLIGYASPVLVSQDKILMTSQGLFLNIDGNLTEAASISFQGNGIYAAEYYGHCGRCGWPVDKNGRCQNQNCNGYGPNKD